MMLSMLISGPRQPGDDIGTYLAPLIEDLKLLWESGVECYDANQEEIFNLRVVLLWTINDFPAYGNLSGFSVKGYKACPICGDNTSAIELKYGKKMTYLGHRRFLARNHPYRRQKKSFNGEKELKTISEPLSGEAIYSRIKDLEFPRGKKKTKEQPIKGSARSCWNKVSSFFELPYWKDLHVRHCLDVMHIEKNICMNILGTLLDIPGKSKDNLNARRDLVHLKIRPELAPINSEKKNLHSSCLLYSYEGRKTLCSEDIVRSKGIDRLDASLDNSSFGRPLSAGVSFELEQDLLYQAHRYVLANTIDMQPYIDKHVEVLQLKYPNKVLHQKWIQEEHNRTFISWLRKEVASEIGMGNVEISDNLRWIAHDPHPFVIKYNSYVINGCRYHTESYGKNRSVQNSEVSLVAKTMQVSSSKDKNPIIGDMSFYGVIQDIWELNYNTFNVAVFRCDWVENNNGMKIDDLGFVLVDLKRIGHKSDSFIMATQARQVFYVEDPSDARWSIVLTPPQRDCEDQSNDDELGDIMLHCQGVPSDMPNVDGDILFTHGANDSKRRSRQEGERKLVEYNEDGVPIGENGTKLNSFIGSCVYYHIPIIYATWIDVPAELKEKIYTIVQNEPELLKRPPYMYSYIDQKQWEEFVRSRLCPHFEEKRKLQQERRKNNKYNHRLSRKDYANLREELKNIPSEESELDRASMWKKARVDKKGQYNNEDVQEVVNRINEEIDKLSEENEKLRLRVQELENIHISTQSTPTSAHGSCSRPRLEYDIQCKKNVVKEVVKEEVNVDVIILNDLQEDIIEVRNKKEVVTSNMKMSLPLKTILRFAEKVMDKDSEIRYQLPFSLFGIGRKTCVLREDIIDFCNMREVKTLTLVAYIAYLHSQDELSNYIFVDPSLIFVGHNIQEVRARNLCSRLMASKPNQLVLAPFNPGGHWALLAINAYDETVYYLDSLRTTSRIDIRYVTDTAITIFRS
ncbi:transposase [Cucumis melo var. makuwa]|uniref:Transposase n=1 Tax=Cucumis melo var. makuwa TaxID=1194695 RepID=A0A5A7U006_CUCMM|nr:transposase [Cucumis melo var. makuwa]